MLIITLLTVQLLIVTQLITLLLLISLTMPSPARESRVLVKSTVHTAASDNNSIVDRGPNNQDLTS